MADWTLTESGATPAIPRTEVLEMELHATQQALEFTQESMADLELALEDRGWIALTMQAARELTREGRRRASGLCRILALQNPLIKRGLAVRTAYIWGQGVSIQARDPEVDAVVQEFLDANIASFHSAQAREEHEKLLGTDGNVYLCAFTLPRTGKVQLRSFDPDEMEDILPNPEDRSEPWFYLRQYTVEVYEASATAGNTRTRREVRRVLYPAMGYYPQTRPRLINGIPVMWGSPVLHVSVNRVDRWSFGMPDAYAAIGWARAYKEFLEDWSKLTKSLSRYAYKVTGSSKGKAQNAATEAARIAAATRPGQSNAGATAFMAGSDLTPVPKTGATIDAESGRPLAGMVAAAIGIPVTMLLSDPGQTGARAVAETLDEPTRLEMEMRRSMWGDAIRRLVGYVIAQSVRAPYGALKGTIQRDEYGREVVTVAGDVDMGVEVGWPSLEKTDIKVLVDAIVAANGTDRVAPIVIARELLKALGVDDLDEALKLVTDEDGNFVDPLENAGTAATREFERGQRGGTPDGADGGPVDDAAADAED